MKSKALILTLFSIFLYSQNTESIAKMHCKCDVVISSNILQDNKIVFIGNETESFFAVNLTYNVIQKVNGQWIKKRKSKISFISNNLDESEKVNLDDFEFAQQNEKATSISIIKINNNDFYYSIIDLGMSGTAHNGMNSFLFIFQDTDFVSKPIKIYYERWDREFSGDYKTETNSIDEYYPFIEETNKFISEIFGISNDDLDSPENFHLKWNSNNGNIYENIENNGIGYFKLIEFFGNDFYEKIKSEYDIHEIVNNKYKMISGFKSPTVIYDQTKNKSIVIYIPQSWPNGGGWGFRSYWPKKIDGETFMIESEDEILKIKINDDLGNGQIEIEKKNSN